jgi:predicted phage-related endonuclease
MSSAFHAERLTGLGGSDIASVFSLGYGCQRRLWYSKHGTPADAGRKANRAMELGQVLEPYFADRYAEETGREVREVPMARAKCDPVLIVHADRMVWRERESSVGEIYSESGVLEIKALGSAAFRQAKHEGLADDYALQLQHGMLVTGSQWGAFCIGSRDTGEICHWDVERNAEVCRTIASEGPAWWKRYVLGADEPARLPDYDSRCATCQYLRTCRADEYMTPETGADMPEAPELAPLLQRYAALDARYSVRIGEGKDAHWGSELDAEYEAVKEELREALGDRDAVTVDGAKVYNRAQAGRLSWDSAGLLKAYPGAAAYQREGKPFRVLKVYLPA